MRMIGVFDSTAHSDAGKWREDSDRRTFVNGPSPHVARRSPAGIVFGMIRIHLFRLLSGAMFAAAALAFVGCASSTVAPTTSTRPADPASPSAKWENDIRAFEAADRVSPPPKGAILFIGSSTIRMWESLASDYPTYRTINRGFGGSEVADSVYFADRVVIPYAPRLIVLNAGTNDINNGKSPEQVAADFQAFVAKVRKALPKTRIAYLAIQPAPSRWDQAPRQSEANRLIRSFIARGRNLDYIEVWDQYLGADGTPDPAYYLPDRLHGNAAGYQIRADVVRPHLAPDYVPHVSD